MPTPDNEAEELRKLARFPVENPNPVLRIAGSGEVDFANAAGTDLLRGLGLGHGSRVVGPLETAREAARRTGTRQRLDVEAGDRCFALDVTAVAEADHVYVYGRDVTEARRVEERILAAKEAADEANRAKSAFLANMSHELRTPLNSIIGYSELLLDDAHETNAALAADLEKIKSAGKHLLDLINEILDFSKIEAGKMEVHCETFSVEGVILDALATTRPLMQRRRNEVVLRLGGVGDMSADPLKVRQILLNLLSNAAKFTESGTITIETRRVVRDGSERVCIDVSDTGIGMSQRQLAVLFQPYVQVEGSPAGRLGGTGLGLTITQRLCQLMGGETRVRSAPGEGSTFTVELPVTVVTEVAPSTLAPSSPRRRAFSGEPLVLTIDDEPAVLEVLARSLRSAGFAVRAATSGEEGLALARELSPSAITLDVMMPGMDGWSVLAQLKSDPELEPIPVIMVTMIDEQRVGYALGAADYLTKPIDRERLLRLMDAHVRGLPSSVLVVDDDEEVRGVMRRTLEREGWTVTEADNGRSALEAFQASAPALVLVDLMMPEMNGFDLIEKLRQDPDAAGVPIIVVTSKDLSSSDRARLNGHVQQTLQKGAYGKEDLLLLLRGALTRHVERRSSPPAVRT